MLNVLVIGKNGEPLMPMKAGGQVRKLLKKKRAKVVCKDPFTIQLLYETKEKTSYYEKVGNFIMKRKVDASLISGMMDALKNQPAPNEGFSKTDDPNFPVWRGEVKKNFLIYVPMTPVRKTADGTMVADPLVTWQHAVHANGGYSSARCFNGIVNETLGFDGVCPLCEAAKECGEEYFAKLAFEAKRLGINENQIKDNPALEGTKTKLNNERAVKRAEEFITFPIVMLSDDATVPLTQESTNNFKVFYFEIRRGTYEDKMLKAINSQVPPMTIGCPESPFGKIFAFNYNYDSKGQEPNIRDAVRNVQYAPVTSVEYYNSIAPLLQYAEQLAAGFTNEKAVEVLKASQIWYKEDYQKMTDNAMLTTRTFLASANSAGAVPMQNGIEQTLSAFSVNSAPAQIAPTVPTMTGAAPAASQAVPTAVPDANAVGTAPMAVGTAPAPVAPMADAVAMATPVAPQIGAV